MERLLEEFMDLRLSGKRALVTGSTDGLGKAIAKLLAAEGVAIVVNGRNESRAAGTTLWDCSESHQTRKETRL
jgi:NAD(P)-dependent dehydrogenase (short-subunit alcohol dehydrogenase family)